jgi:hypothetical protein
VTFAIGIFDLFTYTIPGSLYLAFVSYVAIRVGWVEPRAITGAPTLLLIIALVLLSYLIGYLAYPLGAIANRLLPSRRVRRAPQEFVSRVPAARGHDFVTADPAVLLAALQLHDKDIAVEVTRLRATGLMLRNSAPPLAFASVAAAVELFTGRHPMLAAGLIVIFGISSATLVVHGRRLSHWAHLKTLELGFWVPDLDAKLREHG